MISSKIATVCVSAALLFVLIGTTWAVEYTDCGTQKGSLNFLQVSGCTTDGETCNFFRGRNATIEARFVPNVMSEVARIRVWGVIGGIQIPFRITPDETCGNYGPTCPVQPDVEYPLRISIPVLSSYPKVHVKVRVRLDDETRKPFFCRQFPVDIVDPEDAGSPSK